MNGTEQSSEAKLNGFIREENPCGCHECRVCAMFGDAEPVETSKRPEVEKALLASVDQEQFVPINQPSLF